ncbi:antibiotic biosynthesis monooxygenase [Modestobacter sp. VKM Ac-2985]|uniref:antibiotic biosynthesis monooxygenase n=1 Tax=Modestobacter sp. VKM Ac-2985 TaxID=3004139 RepID=UPI0022ABB5A4|nr:antibiotic biosynthesis monooxygenase [Modestobacter sp. VKM Ac-2985]MCZ2839984.1 antibiotic biosynthesis monooxygenase [Modestobacter sp. VKM Ac-2985]
MHARTTTVRGDPQAVDDGIDYVREAVWPMLRGMSGCVGMSMLADRDAGRCIVTAAWATDEAMRASAVAVGELRDHAAGVMRAESMQVAEWEIAVLHREHPTGDGACTRVVWAEGDPADLDSMVDAFRMSLIPWMTELPGFCSTSLLVDRGTGHAAAAVTYADRDALERSRKTGSAMRREFVAATRVQVTEVAEFDLAVAHLRVPEMA